MHSKKIPSLTLIVILLPVLFTAGACQVFSPQVDSGEGEAASSTLPTGPEPELPQPVKTEAPSPDGEEKRCGDGVCGGPENEKNCPSDCAAPLASQTPGLPDSKSAPTAQPGSGTNTGEGVLYVGIMVHLEGWDDDVNQQRFALHARAVREYADLFEKYGGKLTLESKELTEGIHRWGDNVLLEMEKRGHGVGVHADLGGEKNYDCSRFASELRERKQRLEALGVTVRHVSGNTSTCDWVAATIDAGYQFTTGQVAYSLMSLPVNQRPPEYRNCPNPSACHDVYPTELANRIHPWRARSGADWVTHDPGGRLVILSSSQGIRQMYEETHGVVGTARDMEFTTADLDAYFEQLDQALALSTPGQVNIFYVSWSLGSELDRAVTEEWLSRLRPYIDLGRVQWKTLPEMYDAYIAMGY